MGKLFTCAVMTSLLIGGCSTTNLVTSADQNQAGLKISPLLSNPTESIANNNPINDNREDFCIGLISSLHF